MARGEGRGRQQALSVTRRLALSEQARAARSHNDAIEARLRIVANDLAQTWQSETELYRDPELLIDQLSAALCDNNEMITDKTEKSRAREAVKRFLRGDADASDDLLDVYIRNELYINEPQPGDPNWAEEADKAIYHLESDLRQAYESVLRPFGYSAKEYRSILEHLGPKGQLLDIAADAPLEQRLGALSERYHAFVAADELLHSIEDNADSALFTSGLDHIERFKNNPIGSLARATGLARPYCDPTPNIACGNPDGWQRHFMQGTIDSHNYDRDVLHAVGQIADCGGMSQDAAVELVMRWQQDHQQFVKDLERLEVPLDIFFAHLDQQAA